MLERVEIDLSAVQSLVREVVCIEYDDFKIEPGIRLIKYLLNCSESIAGAAYSYFDDFLSIGGRLIAFDLRYEIVIYRVIGVIGKCRNGGSFALFYGILGNQLALISLHDFFVIGVILICRSCDNDIYERVVRTDLLDLCYESILGRDQTCRNSVRSRQELQLKYWLQQGLSRYCRYTSLCP